MNIETVMQYAHDLVVPHPRNNFKPKALSHHGLSAAAALFIAAKIFTLFILISAIPAGNAFSQSISEQNIIALTNDSRAAFNEQALTQNTALDTAAELKAEDMLDNQYFSHVSPDGLSASDFITNAGYNYIIAGENIAINYYSDTGAAEGWVNNPEHTSTTLDGDYENIGVGIVEGDYRGIPAVIVVEMFGTSMDQQYISDTTQAAVTDTQVSDLVLPALSDKQFPAPILSNAHDLITSEPTYQISGTVVDAQIVYAIDNNKPVASFPVDAKNHFTGTIQLGEGTNAIQFVGFSENNQNSDFSKTINVTLESVGPIITSSTISTVQKDSNSYYFIELHTTGNPVQMLASLGSQTVLLQPTTDPNIWNGYLLADGQTSQGDVMVTGIDLFGNTQSAHIADVQGSIGQSFAFADPTQGAIPVASLQTLHLINMIFVVGIVLLLILLLLAIGIKRNIQHISMIAQTSAIVVLALILWLH